MDIESLFKQSPAFTKYTAPRQAAKSPPIKSKRSALSALDRANAHLKGEFKVEKDETDISSTSEDEAFEEDDEDEELKMFLGKLGTPNTSPKKAVVSPYVKSLERKNTASSIGSRIKALPAHTVVVKKPIGESEQMARKLEDSDSSIGSDFESFLKKDSVGAPVAEDTHFVNDKVVDDIELLSNVIKTKVREAEIEPKTTPAAILFNDSHSEDLHSNDSYSSVPSSQNSKSSNHISLLKDSILSISDLLNSSVQIDKVNLEEDYDAESGGDHTTPKASVLQTPKASKLQIKPRDSESNPDREYESFDHKYLPEHDNQSSKLEPDQQYPPNKDPKVHSNETFENQNHPSSQHPFYSNFSNQQQFHPHQFGTHAPQQSPYHQYPMWSPLGIYQHPQYCTSFAPPPPMFYSPYHAWMEPQQVHQKKDKSSDVCSVCYKQMSGRMSSRDSKSSRNAKLKKKHRKKEKKKEKDIEKDAPEEDLPTAPEIATESIDALSSDSRFKENSEKDSHTNLTAQELSSI